MNPSPHIKICLHVWALGVSLFKSIVIFVNSEEYSVIFTVKGVTFL
jgi:hypothetical protein